MFWRKRDHLTDDDLSAYADGALTADATRRAESHLAACEHCRQALADVRSVKSLLSALPVVEPPRSFVLSPAAVSAASTQGRPQPRRAPYSLGYLPALAMTVLVLLFAVDLAFIDGGDGDRARSLMTTADRATELQTMPAAGQAAPAESERSAAPSPVARAGDEAPRPEPAVDAEVRATASRSDAEDTARTVLRVLQVLVALVFVVSLFVWLRVRLGIG